MIGIREIPLLFVLVLAPCSLLRADDDGLAHLQFMVADDAGQLVPCRIHVYDSAGEPVLASGQPAWRDHFVCAGEVALELAHGTYRYEIERGPEHQRLSGTVELKEDQTVHVTLSRIADMPARGWYAGDLHIHRRPEESPLLLLAEDLHVGQVITWWNQHNLLADNLPDDPLRYIDRQHCFHILAGEDERGGGALLYFNMAKPIDITQAEREFPSSMTYLNEARSEFPDCWVDIEKPFWWDVPLWLASGQVDSIGIANNHMCRSQMYEDEAWGRARDVDRWPPPLGNGYWTQEIYYHALNCGLHVPPSAGSASGVLPNPVGYNRVYVHTGDAERLDYEAWWDRFRGGQCFVTNGPLLLVTANGELPGYVFAEGDERAITLQITLIAEDHCPEIEIIQNGEVIHTIPCEDVLEQQHTATIPLKSSGWFLVRAIADNAQTFRFASTGPFYVDGSEGERISRGSAQFFIDGIQQRREAIVGAVTNAAERDNVLQYVDRAHDFWINLREQATTD